MILALTGAAILLAAILTAIAIRPPTPAVRQLPPTQSTESRFPKMPAQQLANLKAAAPISVPEVLYELNDILGQEQPHETFMREITEAIENSQLEE